MPPQPELCPCGQPLHYTNAETEAYVRRMIAQNGYCVSITVGGRTWSVPRHYIALHSLIGRDLPELAQRYGWQETTVHAVGRN